MVVMSFLVAVMFKKIFFWIWSFHGRLILFYGFNILF